MSFMKPVMAIAAVCVAMLAMTGLARSKKSSKRRGMMRRGHSR
jgi:hypothetical protein